PPPRLDKLPGTLRRIHGDHIKHARPDSVGWISAAQSATSATNSRPTSRLTRPTHRATERSPNHATAPSRFARRVDRRTSPAPDQGEGAHPPSRSAKRRAACPTLGQNRKTL